VPTAVAHPCDKTSLAGALDAGRSGLIQPILVGPAGKIREVAEASGMDLGRAEIVDTPHSHGSAARAVELIRAGRAEMLMKGSLHSDELLAAVVARDIGLRTGRRISHAFVMDVPDTGPRLAVDYFVYRVVKEVGAMAAALGGIDGLVFTAGIGEKSVEVRRRVCEGCSWLGVEIDEEANRGGGPRISKPMSKVSAWVVPTNEELMIARHTGLLLNLI